MSLHPLTEAQRNLLQDEVRCLIECWLKDSEVVENVASFEDETFKVYQTIAEMVERWDEYAYEYREATEDNDYADYYYELEAGK